MNTCHFPFRRTRKVRARPLLPIRIANSETQQALNLYALVDTGARVVALPESYAGLLGFDTRKLRQEEIGTPGGWVTARAALCDVHIMMPNEEPVQGKGPVGAESAQGRVFDSAQKVVVLFLPDLSEPLVGVDELLDRYVLQVDYPAMTFSLSK
jgi:hypothetical protein